jgi:voltage-gated potassium channel
VTGAAAGPLADAGLRRFGRPDAIVPKTGFGRLIASVMMLLGWGILAVPTGIVSAEFTAQRVRRVPTTRTCHECLSEGHEATARWCRDCGAKLPAYAHEPLAG